jgi:hypothetical protein
MTAMVAERSKQPVFVVAEQADHLCADVALKREHGIDAAVDVWASIDVVPEKHHGVVGGHLAANRVKHVGERSTIAVDVPNRNRGHVYDGSSPVRATASSAELRTP